MTNRQIAESFARGKTTGHSLNMFIDGPSVYSYGYHFRIATKTGKTDENGRLIVLFTDRGYSNTTARHKAHVYSELVNQGYRVIECNIDNPLSEKTIEALRVKLAESQLKFTRARKEWSKEYHASQSAELLANIKTLNTVFKVTFKSVYAGSLSV